MSKPVIVSEEAIDVYEVLKEIKTLEKQGDLGFRAQKTKEYIEETKQYADKKAKDAREEIIALDVPRLKKDHVSKIIDIAPVSLEDLKQLVTSFNITVKEEHLKNIFDILSKD
jgi:DNA-directed RNA polymerase subunit F